MVITIIIIMLIFSGVEIGMKNYFDGRKDNFTEEINSNSYDLIFIGSSMLARNVNISILDEELSRLTKRPIKSVGFSFNSYSFPLWYLIIKNRIIPSQKSNIPIVIIGHLIEPENVQNSKGENIPRMFMAFDEPEYYRIRGTPVGITDNLERRFSILFAKEDVAAETLREFISIVTIGIYPDGESVLKKRFTIGQFKKTPESKVENLESLSALWDHIYVTISQKSLNITAKKPMNDEDYLKAGFFPEIIRLTQGRFPVVYVDSHLNPTYDTANFKKTRKVLNKFLTENNVTYLDMNRHEELNNSRLYSDIAHFNQKNYLTLNETTNTSGVEINSRLIARDLYQKKIIQ